MKKTILAILIAAFALSGCTSKPSKQDVIDSMNKKIDSSKLIKGASKSDVDGLKKSIKCTIDKAYPKLNDATLKILTDSKKTLEQVGKDIKGAQEKVLQSASDKC